MLLCENIKKRYLCISKRIKVYFPEIILIAVGLSMDSFAVSLAVGMSYKNMPRHAILRAIAFFGIFQAAFAAFGWLLSRSLKDMIAVFDHWIAFALLAAIGGKMIWAAIKNDPGERSFNISDYLILIGLSVATSIDALIVGMSMGFLDIPVFIFVAVIGIVTVLFSAGGFYLGIRNGFRFLGRNAGLIGGLILIGIGIKVLIRHM